MRYEPWKGLVILMVSMAIDFLTLGTGHITFFGILLVMMWPMEIERMYKLIIISTFVISSLMDKEELTIIAVVLVPALIKERRKRDDSSR